MPETRSKDQLFSIMVNWTQRLTLRLSRPDFEQVYWGQPQRDLFLRCERFLADALVQPEAMAEACHASMVAWREAVWALRGPR
jgi:hypothetical protein